MNLVSGIYPFYDYPHTIVPYNYNRFDHGLNPTDVRVS
jgi:hypothetical protein